MIGLILAQTSEAVGEFTIELDASSAALVPVVALILQLLKNLKVIKEQLTEYLPFVSIAVAFMILAASPPKAASWQADLLPAIAIGLLANGAYDTYAGVAKAIKKRNKPKEPPAGDGA